MKYYNIYNFIYIYKKNYFKNFLLFSKNYFFNEEIEKIFIKISLKLNINVKKYFFDKYFLKFNSRKKIFKKKYIIILKILNIKNFNINFLKSIIFNNENYFKFLLIIYDYEIFKYFLNLNNLICLKFKIKYYIILLKIKFLIFKYNFKKLFIILKKNFLLNSSNEFNKFLNINFKNSYYFKNKFNIINKNNIFKYMLNLKIILLNIIINKYKFKEFNLLLFKTINYFLDNNFFKNSNLVMNLISLDINFKKNSPNINNKIALLNNNLYKILKIYFLLIKFNKKK